MSNISESGLASYAVSATALHNQVQRLEQQCADWQGCVGTSTTDKVKIVGDLRQQIRGLETQIGQAEGASAVTARITVASPEVTPVQGDGINRPVAGATSGSYINLSV